MLNNMSLTEIACKASNLSERISITKNLIDKNAVQACVKPLDSLDTWTLDKLVSKLAVMQIKQQLYEPSAARIPKSQDLKQLLTDYKLCERNLSNLSESVLLEFIRMHSVWLDTYRDALATLNSPKDNFSNQIWANPSIYYGRLAKVCEPFLRLIQKEVGLTNIKVSQCSTDFNINQQVIVDNQLELLNRFEMALARAIEADINVYCYKNRLDKSSNVEEYITYLEDTFKDEQSYHHFYCKFPVLSRWLAQVTKFLIANSQELIQRLFCDRAEISITLLDGRKFVQIQSFKLGQSDPHAGGHSVVLVDLQVANVDQSVEQKTIVYKPRCVQTEAALQSLLEKLTKSGVVHFSTYRVLCKSEYGYTEFIPTGKNHIQTEEDIENFYSQLGGYLAIFHILGGSDMHFENILAANCNAFICDCETILDVLPKGMEQTDFTLFDSVFKTGMLDWPRPDSDEGNSRVNLTGYGGGESYQVPFAVPQIINRMSLALTIEQQIGTIVEGFSTNRLFYNGELVQPQSYQQNIVEAFNKVYKWFQDNFIQAIELVKELFAASSIRFINRATQIYAHLLSAVRHAKCLSDPLETDLVFYSLIEHPRSWDDTGKLADLEFTSLWQLDVPIFTVIADSKDLTYNYQAKLSDTLVLSPLENAVRRIRKLSSENQTRQNQYIYASLSTDKTNSKHFISSATDYACRIGTQLCLLLQPPSNLAPWKTFEFISTGKKVVDVDASIYSGSAGICLFLAYLDTIKPQIEFRQAAERALEHAVAQRDTSMVGAFQGTAGLIYLLTHLAQLWSRPELLEQACELCSELTPCIEQDHYYDIIHGVAGIIPVMLGLAKVTSGKGIEQAELCAQHLLRNAVHQNDTLSWPFNPELAKANLTGFSHGAGGIGWALILLGCHIGKPEYIEAGRCAFAYEATQFDSKERNWYDLRTSVITKASPDLKFAYYWCSGSAGIGLSRIASWALLGKNDEDLLREAYTALNTTLRSLNGLDNDSLCHGKSGNADLLLRFSKLADQPYLQMEANVQAIAQWQAFEQTHRWTCGAGGSDVLPGLMIGLAGIGMHFLRLAYPEKIPSPLLLDPLPF